MKTQMTTERRLLCPSCRRKAKRVTPLTVRALLKDEYAGAIDDAGQPRRAGDGTAERCKPINGDTGWRFCDSQDCDVVYFSEDTDATFTKSQLRVSVGVKERAGERPLCYCFGHSVASIKAELRTKGRCDALEDIRRKMKDPGCRCETENPSGSCCLGSVTKGIQIAREELGMTQMNDKELRMSANEDVLRPQKPVSHRGETIAKIGTILSAIMASSCCWLPLLLLAVGVSGAGIASTLDAYRPLFIVVTFGFLGAAFYFTYRPRRVGPATAGGEHDCCAPAATEAVGCCSPSAGAKTPRFNMMAMNKIMLWVVTVLAVAFLLFPTYVGALLGTNDADAVTERMNRAVFKIEGMTCESCAAIVENTIRSVPGVLAAQVSYQDGEAVVGTEICCPVPKEPILMALKQAGFTGRFVEPAARRGASRDPGKAASAHEASPEANADSAPIVTRPGFRRAKLAVSGMS